MRTLLPTTDDHPVSRSAIARAFRALGAGALLATAVCTAADPNPVIPPRTSVAAPAPERVAEIRAWLDEAPVAPGRPVADRKAWHEAAARLSVKEFVAEAERVAAEPIPELPDDLFLLYGRTGSRLEYQEPFRDRLGRLGALVCAEGLEARGRFLPVIAQNLQAILAEKTWVVPAHDPGLKNFSGDLIEVNLTAAMRGWSLAIVDYWLGEQLPADLRGRLRAELRRRVVDPYLAVVRGAPLSRGMRWITWTNNWNAVCHAGVVGTALALGIPADECAEIVAAAEASHAFFINGFTDDGYCSEGVGYWNYGFGHDLMLAETVAQATGGRLQWLAGEKVRRIAEYPANLEILPGVFPSFSDARMGAHPAAFLRALAARRLASPPAPLSVESPTVETLRGQPLYQAALHMFLPSRPPAEEPGRAARSLRHWFDEAQVFVTRADQRFGAAIKGGHNGEHHNHNDAGTLVVAVGSSTPLVDPGLEVYTARTFSADRYQSNVINSYGHAVPLVAGQLQVVGREHAARVVETAFSDASDRLVLDLREAYAVAELTSLQRTFVLTRGANPAITVTDSVAFAQPQAFGTALITFESWREDGPGALVVGEGEDAVRVEFSATGGTVRLRAETIEETLPDDRKPTRLGLDFAEPVTSASIQMTIRPMR